MGGRHFLFVPGPTNVPDRIARAMEDHRSSKFPGFTLPLFQDLRKVFKSTDGQAGVYFSLVRQLAKAGVEDCWQ